MISQGFLFRSISAALAIAAVLAVCGAPAASASAASGSISGTLTGAPTHAPVAGVEACAVERPDLLGIRHCVWTGADGSYGIGSLPQGEYDVMFWPHHGTGLNYYREGVGPVQVGAGPTAGVDYELEEAGSIEGRVVSELDGTPLAGVEVCAYYQWEDDEPSCAITDAFGKYRVVGLGTVGEEQTEYRLEFFPERSRLPYFRSYGGLVGFDEEIDDLVQAEVVSVTKGHVTKVADQTLRPDAEVQGFVTAAYDGAPLKGVLVCAAPALASAEEAFQNNIYKFQGAKCARTDSAGAYSVGGLVGGPYKVLFSVELREFRHYIPPLEPEEDGYPTLYWRDGSSWAEADVLNLTPPIVATDIDAQLGPAPPSQAPATSTSSTSPAPPAPSLLPAAATPSTSVPRPRCKRGWRVKKVDGRYHCVKPLKTRRKRHRHPARRHRARVAKS